MKKIAVLLTTAILAGTLASCSAVDTARLPADSTAPDAVIGGTSSAHSEMKAIHYTPTSYLEDFDCSREVRFGGDVPRITFTVPEDWKGSGAAYQSYDSRISGYTRAFEIYEPIKVASDYVMAEDMIYRRGFDKVFSRKIVEGAVMETRQTDTGYGYVSFVYTGDAAYTEIAFVRVTQELIVPCTFVLPRDKADVARQVLDSMVFRSEDKGEAVPEALASYMQYFVNYVHEPMEAGADLSGSNLLYLVFLNCYDNHELYNSYGVTMAEDGSELKIPGNFARELCKTLTGKAYDLTKYHSYFANSADSYSAEEDMYTFVLGTDYWNGDSYYIDNDTEMQYEDCGGTVTVTAQVYFSAGLGEPKEQERTMMFEFEKFGMSGGMLYRIVSITEIK